MGLRKLSDFAYLYPGSPSTLFRIHKGKVVIVDPGHGKSRHKDLAREARKLGLEIKAQLATHGHADHVAVSTKLEAPLYIHRFEFSIAESPLARDIITFGAKAPKGFLVFQFPEEVRVHAVFEWGDELFGLKTVDLSGHSPGMTGFLDKESGLIYAGDAFFGERLLETVGVPYFVDVSSFKRSLGELMKYAEEGYLLIPSHGMPVKGEEAEEVLRKNLNRVEKTEELVLELLKTPRSIDEIAFELMKEYSVEITPKKLALNLVPVRAIIAEFYNEGLIEAVVEKGLKWRVVKG
ncbi:zinc-dependent hydrolase [Thermococcus guaymasensis DSM 11113]|uniref:Zinc-dependent hydrolase n=1 Tax=Thermococcus guaymasensis DSM 11113 TaxID=1432656 RepID=A0A0X1KKT3_9EURY|nr:MBL fold metallo-hydrolase [Thermococcus guaymasensis]AJC71891.1 zinc-dependent hydrolase [Thermococcus guaymasensis DSM 11113]